MGGEACIGLFCYQLLIEFLQVQESLPIPSPLKLYGSSGETPYRRRKSRTTRGLVSMIFVVDPCPCSTAAKKCGSSPAKKKNRNPKPAS